MFFFIILYYKRTPTSTYIAQQYKQRFKRSLSDSNTALAVVLVEREGFVQLKVAESPLSYHRWKNFLKFGGERGIRTPDTAIQPYDGLANRCLQPLGHLSVKELFGYNHTQREYNKSNFVSMFLNNKTMEHPLFLQIETYTKQR